MKKFVILAVMLTIAVGTVIAHHIYKGVFTSYTDIVYTYDDRHIYRGNSTSYTDIVYTFD